MAADVDVWPKDVPKAQREAHFIVKCMEEAGDVRQVSRTVVVVVVVDVVDVV